MIPNHRPVDIQQCEQKVGNRFDLILMAALRSREINAGRTAMIKGSYRSTVIALLEIEQGLVSRDILRKLGRRS